MSDEVEVVEPVAPDAEAPENVAEAVADANEPAEAEVTEVDEPAAPPAVSLEDAVKAVLIYVKAHRTIGDADLAAAVADVEAALPAQE